MYAVAPKDGTTLAMCPSIILLTEALNPGAIHFTSAKFGWIGNITPTTHILALDKSAGIQSIRDATTKSTTLGATVATGADYVEGVLTNSLLGTKFKIVRGYNTGTQEMSLAMQRGEIHGFVGSWDSWVGARGEWVGQDKLVYLLQFGPKVPELPDVPTLSDLVKQPRYLAVTKLSALIETMGRSIFTTPDVPQDQLSILRAAFDATMHDQSYLATMKARQLEVRPRSGQQIQGEVDAALSSRSDAAADMRELLNCAQ